MAAAVMPLTGCIAGDIIIEEGQRDRLHPGQPDAAALPVGVGDRRRADPDSTSASGRRHRCPVPSTGGLIGSASPCVIRMGGLAVERPAGRGCTDMAITARYRGWCCGTGRHRRGQRRLGPVTVPGHGHPEPSMRAATESAGGHQLVGDETHVGRLVVDVVLVKVRPGHVGVGQGELRCGHHIAMAGPVREQVGVGRGADVEAVGEHHQRPTARDVGVPHPRRQHPLRADEVAPTDRGTGVILQGTTTWITR